MNQKHKFTRPMILALLFRLEWLSWATCASLFFAGCNTTLDPAGVYKGDKVLYEADNTIVTSHDLLQDFVNWEANNRTVLQKVSPEIQKFADTIVAQGPMWFSSAAALRDAYKPHH
jgi:hypothetical protein